MTMHWKKNVLANKLVSQTNKYIKSTLHSLSRHYYIYIGQLETVQPAPVGKYWMANRQQVMIHNTRIFFISLYVDLYFFTLSSACITQSMKFGWNWTLIRFKDNKRRLLFSIKNVEDTINWSHWIFSIASPSKINKDIKISMIHAVKEEYTFFLSVTSSNSSIFCKLSISQSSNKDHNFKKVSICIFICPQHIWKINIKIKIIPCKKSAMSNFKECFFLLISRINKKYGIFLVAIQLEESFLAFFILSTYYGCHNVFLR